jgi:hypothetical protein
LAERRARKIVTDWSRRLHTHWGLRVPLEELDVLKHDIVHFYAVMRVSDRLWRTSPKRPGNDE